MNSFIILIGYVLSFFFSHAVIAQEKNDNNFVLISNNSQKSKSLDYRIPDSDSVESFTKLSYEFQKKFPNLSPIYLFDDEEYVDSKLNQNILAFNRKNILFLINNNKIISKLGKIIDANNQAIQPFINSISNSKLIVAYCDTKATPIAIVLDNKNGAVYSVKRTNNQDISIKQIGLSNIPLPL
ncbi:hypothetical protein [Fluviispira sanaruensis]|uniref:Uncharacterized protein n=1 Tax=Fluviispira sanaruensis TaxID=2493639 RepID=A0A4P2VM55_FLUSA|nr:hypothetical protein [Fluviispira sanaruensis]BBH54463.1 hypothetical protein JCM31447_29340 [Fluviispira sanaruensis]